MISAPVLRSLPFFFVSETTPFQKGSHSNATFGSSLITEMRRIFYYDLTRTPGDKVTPLKLINEGCPMHVFILFLLTRYDLGHTHYIFIFVVTRKRVWIRGYNFSLHQHASFPSALADPLSLGRGSL